MEWDIKLFLAGIILLIIDLATYNFNYNTANFTELGRSLLAMSYVLIAIGGYGFIYKRYIR